MKNRDNFWIYFKIKKNYFRKFVYNFLSNYSISFLRKLMTTKMSNTFAYSIDKDAGTKHRMYLCLNIECTYVET